MIYTAPFPDLDALVFADAFALTRITPPKKVKNVKDITDARPSYMQPMDRQVMISGVDEYAFSRLCSVPDLKSQPFRELHSYFCCLAPDGEMAYQFDVHRKNRASAGGAEPNLEVSAFLREALNNRNIVIRARFRLGRSQRLPAPREVINLGGDQVSGPFHHVWTDGRFLTSRGPDLICGQITGKRFEVRWRLLITHGLDPLRTELRVEGDDLWIMGETLGGGEAVVARVNPEGQVAHWRFEALETPAYHQGQVALLVDECTVERFPLANPSARERFTFDPEVLRLEGGVDPDDIRIGPALPREAEPDCRGRVMMQGEQLYYLPWHGEAIIHLNATSPKAQIIPRKLSPKTRDLRTFFCRWSSRLRAAGYEAGASVQPTRVWTKAHGLSMGVSNHAFTANFTTLCLAGALRESQERYRLAETFGKLYRRRFHILPFELSGPVSVADVQAGFAFMTRHGLSAVDLAYPLETRFEQQTAAELFEPEARPLVAEAILASCIGEPRAATPVCTVEEMERRLAAASDPYVPHSFKVEHSVRHVVGRLLA